MGVILSCLESMLDATIHPHNRNQGGMTLLRSRMLSLSCIMTVLTCIMIFAVIVHYDRLDLGIFAPHLMMGHGILFLSLNRCFQRNVEVAAVYLILLSVFLAVGILFQAQSISATGFLWFQVLIVPAFLLCGWRYGLAVSTVILLVALGTLGFCLKFGTALPFGGDREVGVRSMLMTAIFVNGLTLTMVAIYFRLLHQSERISQEQREWVQRTARMQELLQMSGHFALKTNGPLDVLGTALHNLEEPLKDSMQPRTLLDLLEPLESGIQDLADVARSFSLFSRRYLEEGLEQTSINVVLQHVDTIYNVGSALRLARLHWQKAAPDILIHTQTAKLVMLIVSVLRNIAAEGGSQLQLHMELQTDGLQLFLSYQMAPFTGRDLEEADVHVLFDPELTGSLIQELCSELGVELRRRQEGEMLLCGLKLKQAKSQARFA
ncbi:hypothetical protein [Oligoflexus tunisiensis]|uniref:hypothetical protein n=1 Tax=Oligoflexus tunisiensis TaxID=708132 RepID=UPI00114CF2BB|nr:hypothetical protein [Oligoflexus tunisiensis]